MMTSSHLGESNETLAEKFYDSSSTVSIGAWSESLLNLRRTYNRERKYLPPVFKSSLEGPSVSWEVFKRLNQALWFARNKTYDCFVFSYEERCPDSTGQRLFLVTHPTQMWINHKQRPADERCTYEVIRENDPCKLYFDLEFNKGLNPLKDGVQMTKSFIEHIILCMHDEYGVDLKENDFLWLDASTPNKYSCHLILQKEEIAFHDNIQAGGFVRQSLSRIKTNDFRVKKKDNKEGLFCDDGVYTKNRNFRLYLSTKWGKRAPLLLSAHNSYDVQADEETVFYSSLITYFKKGTKLRLLTFTKEDSPKANLNSTYVKLEKSIKGCSGSSPYPALDDFVTSYLIRDQTYTGFIRRWTYCKETNRLIYDVGRYRFCRNIGRHHTSNNIMIVVDLNSRVFYQKCHDPECRLQNYRSPTQALPETVINRIPEFDNKVPHDFFDEKSFDFSDDSSDDCDGVSAEEEWRMAEAARLVEDGKINNE